MRIGDPVQNQQQRRPGERIEQIVEAFLPARVFDSRDGALVPAAGVEAVQARTRHPHELHAMDLGQRNEILRPRIRAAFIEEDLDDRGRLGAQSGLHRMETGNDPRSFHCASTKSMRLISRSTRAIRMRMRSASR